MSSSFSKVTTYAFCFIMYQRLYALPMATILAEIACITCLRK